MNSYNIFTLSTLLLLFSVYQINAESSTYTAAVIGMKADKLLTQPDYTLYISIEHYTNLVGYLMHNSSHKPDIIIFPEGGLQGENEPFPIQVPSTEDSVVPCNLGDRFSAALISLSCLAKAKQVYLVVNLVESHFNISSNRTMTFNTNVAFDRDGTIVARYRKSNLNEIGYDTPGKPDISSFQTDFDVTFGLLTGNDLLFKEPMYTLKKHKVKHFIHPTKWENELPFFTGIQMQSSWAYVTNSVLLSAGYNHPELGYSGVGVYQGREGPIDYTQSESSRSFAIIADVPKYASQPKNILRSAIPIATNEPKLSAVSLDKVINQPSQLLEDNIEKMEEKIRNRHSPLKVKSMKSVVYRSFLRQKRDKVELFKTKLIEPVIDPEKFSYNSNPQEGVWYFGNTSAIINETICTGTTKNKNQFCCKFQVKMTTFYSTRKQLLENSVSGDNFTNYHYRLAVYNGIKNFTSLDASVPGNIQVCGIIPCLTKKIESCALRTDSFKTEPPVVAPPAAIEVKGRNYTSIGTKFEIINIETEIKYNDSTAYPIILLKSPTTDEFGSLPSVDTFTFLKEVKNNTHDIIVSLKTNREITDLGSISIFTRIYNIPSSSSRNVICYSLFVASFIIIYSLVLH